MHLVLSVRTQVRLHSQIDNSGSLHGHHQRGVGEFTSLFRNNYTNTSPSQSKTGHMTITGKECVRISSSHSPRRTSQSGLMDPLALHAATLWNMLQTSMMFPLLWPKPSANGTDADCWRYLWLSSLSIRIAEYHRLVARFVLKQGFMILILATPIELATVHLDRFSMFMHWQTAGVGTRLP